MRVRLLPEVPTGGSIIGQCSGLICRRLRVRVPPALPIAYKYALCYNESMRVSAEKNREYQHRWYEQNKELQCQRVRERNRKLHKWAKDLKAQQGCTRCKENNPVALDFHHIGNKNININAAVRNGWGKKRILTEIEKCIILCANCHRKEHAG